MWRFKVLVADDQQNMRQVIKAIIEDVGGEVVVEAVNGEDAVQKYIQYKPHLTLLDVNMPVVDGKTALRSIRDVNSRACVVMLTSDNKSDVVKQCITLGARAYVLKNNMPDIIAREVMAAWTGYVNQLCGIK
jgi:two-component system, chemotaxis family, chemotaxis protein CheY